MTTNGCVCEDDMADDAAVQRSTPFIPCLRSPTQPSACAAVYEDNSEVSQLHRLCYQSRP